MSRRVNLPLLSCSLSRRTFFESPCFTYKIDSCMSASFCSSFAVWTNLILLCVVFPGGGQETGTGRLGPKYQPRHRAGADPGSDGQGAGAAGVAPEDGQSPVPHQPRRVLQ